MLVGVFIVAYAISLEGYHALKQAKKNPGNLVLQGIRDGGA